MRRYCAGRHMEYVTSTRDIIADAIIATAKERVCFSRIEADCAVAHCANVVRADLEGSHRSCEDRERS